jgi:phospholipid/cholesterol/gamma-HCH transport system substrate-binding protein
METIMGAVVICVAAFFIATAYSNSGIRSEDGYNIVAAFDRVDGVTRGTDVKVGGIKIGSVEELRLNPETYRAEITLDIRKDIKLPADSTAEISSDGLLGGKFVNIVPGADEEFLKEGSRIEYTQSSLNLEQLLGKFAFGSADEKAMEEGTDQPPAELEGVAPAPSAAVLSEDKPAASPDRIQPSEPASADSQ